MAREADLPADPSKDPVSWRLTVDKGILKDLGERDIKRQEMIYELIQTERGFFRHLTILKTLFQLQVGRSGILTKLEMRRMFSNVDQIAETAEGVCRPLEALQAKQRGAPIHTLGLTLQPLFANLRPDNFAFFCADQKAAVDFYHDKKKSDPKFAGMMAQIESSTVCERLKFPDFMAKVMQRLTKYPLLLKGILK